MSLKRGLFLALLCGSPFCRAGDTGNNLEFTGTIVAQTCDVEISSVSQSIDLGQFSVEDFPATGTTTKFKPFNINLKTAPGELPEPKSGLPARQTVMIHRCWR